MQWSGQKKFEDSPTVPFQVEGAEAGQLKTYGPLSFLKVYFSLSLSLFPSIYLFVIIKYNCGQQF